jgi:hypothetical protein
MKQQINLYQTAPSTWESSLPATTLIKFTVGLLVVLVAASVYTGVMAWMQDEKLAEVREQKDVLSRQLAGLAKQEAERTADPEFAARVDALQEEVGSKTQLVDSLSARVVGDTRGFSSLLAGLARQHVDGVWLKKIEIGNGGQRLSLVGSALRADGVPELLEQLSSEGAFVGREFKTFELQLGDDTRVIDFWLVTGLERTS